MEILKIHINITEINEVVSKEVTAKMILFDGFCEGDFFNGTILNGGVDTQMIRANENGTLSARYILKGHDNKNNPCSLFIENNAILGGSHTNPTIYTDSEELKWLEKEELIGRIDWSTGKLLIIIEKKESN